jgi:cation diffusion facilitator CzcD-associated flavoprotein CzcO
MKPDHEVAIVGGGISGLGVGAALKHAGRDDFVIFERADDIGGTWRANTYPGVAVDIPAFAYQYSYYRNPDWSHLYAPGAEVKAYLDRFADDMGLRPHLRLGVDVTARTWDEAGHHWVLTLGDGSTVTARFCVGAIGAFCEPAPPPFPGFEDFAGKVIRSCDWDHDYDLTGKRVACVGTGASGLQLIPEVGRVAAHLDVYQRTPIWVGVKKDPAIHPRLQRLLARSPLASKLMYKLFAAPVELFVIKLMTNYTKAPWVVTAMRKAVAGHHERSVADPVLRAKVTPDYEYACKRPSFSNTYLPTLQMDHVEVVTDTIERFVPEGIRTVDGTVRPVDVVVLATGFIGAFDPQLYRMRPVRGRDGFDLAEHWEQNRLSAYEGLLHPGLPNHFHVFGPYAGIAGTFHPLVEVAGDFIVRLVGEAERRGATSVEVTPEAHREYHRRMLRRMKGALWYNAPCESSGTYYYATHGDVLLVRPTPTKEARRIARTFPFEHIRFDGPPVAQPEPRREEVAA